MLLLFWGIGWGAWDGTSSLTPSLLLLELETRRLVLLLTLMLSLFTRTPVKLLFCFLASDLVTDPPWLLVPNWFLTANLVSMGLFPIISRGVLTFIFNLFRLSWIFCYLPFRYEALRIVWESPLLLGVMIMWSLLKLFSLEILMEDETFDFCFLFFGTYM